MFEVTSCHWTSTLHQKLDWKKSHENMLNSKHQVNLIKNVFLVPECVWNLNHFVVPSESPKKPKITNFILLKNPSNLHVPEWNPKSKCWKLYDFFNEFEINVWRGRTIINFENYHHSKTTDFPARIFHETFSGELYFHLPSNCQWFQFTFEQLFLFISLKYLFL